MRDEGMEPWISNEAQFNAASRNMVRFEKRPKKNEAKSLEAGRPIFDEVDYIEIATPGDKNNIVHRPMREDDHRKYAQQYKAWKTGQDSDVATGLPLAAWAIMDRATVEEFAYFKIRTVEQLASVSDGNAQRLGTLKNWIPKAKDYMDQAKGAAPLAKLRDELALRDNQLETLQRQMTELTEKLEQQAKPEKKKGNG